MTEIASVRVLARGLTMAFTCKDSRTQFLDLSGIGQMLSNLKELGFDWDHDDSVVEVEFRDFRDAKIHGVSWWVSTNYNGQDYLDYYLEDDGVSEAEDGTTAYLNARGW